MKQRLSESEEYLILNSEKDGVLCRFILKENFTNGVIASGNYHFHSAWEMHLPVKGEMRVMAGDRELHVQPGEVCLIPPQVSHYVYGDERAYRLGFRFTCERAGKAESRLWETFAGAFGGLNCVQVLQCPLYEKYLCTAAENLRRELPGFMTAELVSEVKYSSAFISNLRTVDTTVKQLSKTFLIVGLVLAVFAVLLFSNFISASISQKTRDIGILRAVGARGTDVFRIFFSESFVIVLICAALSIAASYVVCGFIDAQLNEGIGATVLSFGVMSVAVLLVSAFFTALISTFLPVYNAARKKPVESIRSL